MTIALHPVVPMRHTYFDLPDALDYFASRGIVLTSSPARATMHLTNRFPGGRAYGAALAWRVNRPRRPVFVWTHEPRFCRLTRRTRTGGPLYPAVHVHSIYTRDIYLNNYTIYGGSIDRQIEHVRPDRLPGWERPNRIVALASYRTWWERRPVVVEGRNIDLFARRQALIRRGAALGVVDVYGRGWPRTVSSGDSRAGNWGAAKHEILGQYRFNICLGSVAFDYYCTEKIWQAIRARCLPIYSGGHTRIYEDFPRASFVDSDEFSDADALFRGLAAMSREEYCERLNRCIDVFNRIHARGDFPEWRRRSIVRTADRIEAIAATL